MGCNDPIGLFSLNNYVFQAEAFVPKDVESCKIDKNRNFFKPSKY